MQTDAGSSRGSRKLESRDIQAYGGSPVYVKFRVVTALKHRGKLDSASAICNGKAPV